MCDATPSEVVDIAIDPSNWLLYTLLVSGDIIAYDTRYSVNSTPVLCKAVTRYFS